MSAARYIAIAPARLGMRKEIGPASYLHDFLIDRQTDAEGRVLYGRAITYRWILANWPEIPERRPGVRTLKRHMEQLKRAGLLEVRIVGKSHGMRIRLLDSVKWPSAIPAPPVQLSLFAPAPTPIRRPASVGKTVEKVLETGGNPEEAKSTECHFWHSVGSQGAKSGT